MARIVGVDLPKNKRGEIGLTYIYGIGRSTARKILDEAGISYDVKVQALLVKAVPFFNKEVIITECL